MTPSQVWQTFTEIVSTQATTAKVLRRYALDEDLENLATEERPLIAVTLTSSNTDSTTTDAKVIEDTYTFTLTFIWKLKAENNFVELDTRLDQSQFFMKSLRHRYFDANDSRLYLGIPECTSPYDIELIHTGVFLATYNIPITVYHHVN